MNAYLIHHLLENIVPEYSGKVSVTDGRNHITFGELAEESGRMAALLRELAIKRGERVAILLEKSIEQVISLFAVSKKGAVSVFINPVLKKDQVEHILGDCQAQAVICKRREWERYGIAMPLKVIYMDPDGYGAAREKEDEFHWARVREQLAGRPVEDGQISDDIAKLIYTSGSTGKPKGVVFTHRNLIEGAEIVSQYLEITNNERIISVLPFNFDYGLNQLTTAILKGATLVLHNFFLANDLLRVLEGEKITGLAGMNPIWVKIFNEKRPPGRRYDFSHLRYITNSGGKVPEAIVRKMQAFFPKTRIFLMYGLTEAFRSTYLPPEELDKRPNSIGKAIPNVEILVVNEKGEECKPGEVGELVHRGALITRGYWNDPEKTEKVFRRNTFLKGQIHLNEPVVYSGDLVMKDKDGFLYYVSRKDSMIKTMGYRVSPTEVEEALMKIEGVRDAVAFGKEIETGDQIVVAVIQNNSNGIEEKDILLQCRKNMPEYMVPKKFHFEEAFPKTANGKVDRSLLKQKWS